MFFAHNAEVVDGMIQTVLENVQRTADVGDVVDSRLDIVERFRCTALHGDVDIVNAHRVRMHVRDGQLVVAVDEANFRSSDGYCSLPKVLYVISFLINLFCVFVGNRRKFPTTFPTKPVSSIPLCSFPFHFSSKMSKRLSLIFI